MPVADPILIFTILITVILAAPLAAERLRIPDLVLLILAGVALGPHGSGLLDRGAAITLLGSVGLLYIMFLAGLEIELHRFAAVWKRSLSFGLMTFAIPQGMGALVGYHGLGFSLPASLLLGAMFASHTLLAYPIASRLGIGRNEAVAVAVSATIIADTLALLVLAVVADMAKGESAGPSFWAGFGLGMATLGAAAWWGIPLLSRWFFSSVTEKGGAQFLFVLATVCASAWLSHFAKMEPIIGAFLAGAAFNRLIPDVSALMSRIQFVGHSLFIPFFLISVGMLVDPGALLHTGGGWVTVLVMAVVAVASKWLAAALAAWLFGYGPCERQVMFGLTVVRAAAVLAIVLVGHDLGIFDERVLNGVIVIIIVTCTLGAVVVERKGRRLAAKSAGQPARPGREQRLVVAVAKPETATRLMDLAFLLRNPALPGGIYAVSIVREGLETAVAVVRGEKMLAQCLAHAAAAEVQVMPGIRVGINVSDGLINISNEVLAESIIIGWSGKWAGSGRFFGTVRENLLEDCPSRIFLCRLARPLNTTRRLFLPLPPLAERRQDILALIRDAKWLARQGGAELWAFLSHPGADARFRAMIDRVRPSIPVRYWRHLGWAEARAALFEAIRSDDMVILPMERPQSAFWTPSLQRLPEMVVSRFPETNILTVYPGLRSDGGLSAGLPDVRGLSAAVIACDEAGGAKNATEAVQCMMDRIGDWSPSLKNKALSQLLEAAGAYPVELLPGVVLLHTHAELNASPVILTAAGNWTWTLTGMKAPPRVLLALISPKDQAPELHLRLLSALARILGAHSAIKDPAGPMTAADVAAALQEGLGEAAADECVGPC